MLSPLLLQISSPIESERIILRPATIADAPDFYDAIKESQKELSINVGWCKELPSFEKVQENIINAESKWILREAFSFLLIEKESDKVVGDLLIHEINWKIPKFEIGYWIRTSCTGKGFATEAVNITTRFLFTHFKANRVEIQCDSDHVKSMKIPQELGYEHEATLKKSHRKNSGELIGTAIFARFDESNLPPLKVTW